MPSSWNFPWWSTQPSDERTIHAFWLERQWGCAALPMEGRSGWWEKQDFFPTRRTQTNRIQRQEWGENVSVSERDKVKGVGDLQALPCAQRPILPAKDGLPKDEGAWKAVQWTDKGDHRFAKRRGVHRSGDGRAQGHNPRAGRHFFSRRMPPKRQRCVATGGGWRQGHRGCRNTRTPKSTGTPQT